MNHRRRPFREIEVDPVFYLHSNAQRTDTTAEKYRHAIARRLPSSKWARRLVLVAGLSSLVGLHHIAERTKTSPFDERVPVYTFPPDKGGQAEVGLRHSRLLVEATDPDAENVVWAVNWIIIRSKNRCDPIIKEINDSIQRRRRRSFTKYLKYLLGYGENSATASGWQMVLYDYSDNGNPINECVKTLASLLGGRHNVKFARRNLVDGRDFSCFSVLEQPSNLNCFNETFPLRQLYGHASDYSSTELPQYIHNGVIAKFHIGVRSDLAIELSRLFRSRQRQNVTMFRPCDVAHFWRIQPSVDMASLRNRVSEAILSLGKQENITVLADLVSPRSVVGRNSVNKRYAESLIKYKIIVVCQRDGWEDHLRLMEAQISGALVLSDPMIHMPVGYKHGENIIIYESIADLKGKIMYYLKHREERIRIARAGRRLAMEHHRPWHRMERFVLGKWPEGSADPVIPPIPENNLQRF